MIEAVGLRRGGRRLVAAVVAGGIGLVLAGAIGCERSQAPSSGAAAPSQPAAAPATQAQPTPAAAGPDAAAVEAAEQIFATRCTTCHGPLGAGNGPGSAALDPKPRDFRDPTWQAAVTDEQIQQAILYGGAAIGKSPAMPGNPDLMAKPQVTAALVAHVRSLKQP